METYVILDGGVGSSRSASSGAHGEVVRDDAVHDEAHPLALHAVVHVAPSADVLLVQTPLGEKVPDLRKSQMLLTLLSRLSCGATTKVPNPTTMGSDILLSNSLEPYLYHSPLPLEQRQQGVLVVHEHLAVALVLAALGWAGAGQGEQLEVEVAVVPPPEAVDDAPDGAGADLGAEQVRPGEAGGRRRDGHADHVRGEVVGGGRERDGLHRRRRRRGRVVAGRRLRPLAGGGVLCLVIAGRLPLSVGG